jgi:DNA-binding NarL/FixJ family response regulator
MTIRTVIADDHPLILEALSGLFALEPDIEVVERCTDGLRALRAIEEHRPDVAILDISMPRMDGLSVAKEVQRRGIPSRLVLLTATLNEDQVVDAVRSGVRGMVLKQMAPNLIVQCVRKVHEGGHWVETASFARALEKIVRGDISAQEPPRQQIFTPREMDIVHRVTRGLLNKQIADELGISEGTVKAHVHAIYKKLGISSRVELTNWAHDNRIG